MHEIVEDPDFEEFDGAFVDNKNTAPPFEYDYNKAAKYMKLHSKSFFDLTKKEIESFKL